MPMKIMIAPQHVISAVTHPDPYPFYDELLRQRPLYYDDTLKSWVALSGQAVSAILATDAFRVRPVAEPAPRNLVGSTAGSLFGSLVRMTDGAGHCPLKQAITHAIGATHQDEIRRVSAACAGRLVREVEATVPGRSLDAFNFSLSTHVVGRLLDIDEALLPRAAELMSRFVRCIAPGGTEEQVDAGKVAADDLHRLMQEALAAQTAADRASLLTQLQRYVRQVGVDDVGLVCANAIGFMSQAYEATAGLIGNTLVLLARRPDLCQRVRANPALMPALVSEVARFDAPIQNTRRFARTDVSLLGCDLKEGDAVLLVLAAANRDDGDHGDGAANARPHEFDLARRDARMYTFGHGAHRCPGDNMAVTIAGAGVAALLAHGLAVEQLAAPRYRASMNARLPLFALPE